MERSGNIWTRYLYRISYLTQRSGVHLSTLRARICRPVELPGSVKDTSACSDVMSGLCMPKRRRGREGGEGGREGGREGGGS